MDERGVSPQWFNWISNADPSVVADSLHSGEFVLLLKNIHT